jgi:hypothetical protein
MDAYIPDHWRQVERCDFDEFLAHCEDYRTGGWANGIVYYFSRTNKRFAIEQDTGPILIDPLAPITR